MKPSKRQLQQQANVEALSRGLAESPFIASLRRTEQLVRHQEQILDELGRDWRSKLRAAAERAKQQLGFTRDEIEIGRND
jgi:hypothetical protein